MFHTTCIKWGVPSRSKQRKEYASWFTEFALTKLHVVYIDESGFNVWIQKPEDVLEGEIVL